MNTDYYTGEYDDEQRFEDKVLDEWLTQEERNRRQETRTIELEGEEL